MAGFREVFARKELKYRMRFRRKAALMKLLGDRVVPDEYGLTRITSVYYDTPDRLLAFRSYDKPVYKEKLRLRTYGDPADDQRAFVEIKKKLKGIVYKRRIGMSYAAARAYLSGMPFEQACRTFPLANDAENAACFSARSLQIAREIDAFRARYGTLEPAIAVECMRESFTERVIPTEDATGVSSESTSGLAGGGIRITFDSGLRWYDLADPSAPAHTLLAPDETIMEVKTAGALPLWFTHVLDQVGDRPTSYSKYGEAFHAQMTEEAESSLAVRTRFADAAEACGAASARSTSNANAGPVGRTPRHATIPRARHARRAV